MAAPRYALALLISEPCAKPNTCGEGASTWRLQMTIFPPVDSGMRGSSEAGLMRSEVPRHIERSAVSRLSSARVSSSSGSASSQSRICLTGRGSTHERAFVSPGRSKHYSRPCSPGRLACPCSFWRRTPSRSAGSSCPRHQTRETAPCRTFHTFP